MKAGTAPPALTTQSLTHSVASQPHTSRSSSSHHMHHTTQRLQSLSRPLPPSFLFPIPAVESHCPPQLQSGPHMQPPPHAAAPEHVQPLESEAAEPHEQSAPHMQPPPQAAVPPQLQPTDEARLPDERGQPHEAPQPHEEPHTQPHAAQRTTQTWTTVRTGTRATLHPVPQRTLPSLAPCWRCGCCVLGAACSYLPAPAACTCNMPVQRQR